MSSNTGNSKNPTTHLESVVKWLKQYGTDNKSQSPSPESLVLSEEFQKIYANPKLSDNMLEPNARIQKYQVEWEKLLLRNEVCLPPIPEAYLVKLINSAFRDAEIHARLEPYIKPYIRQTYSNRVMTESCRQVVDENALEEGADKSSADDIMDGILDNVYSQRFKEEDGHENDMQFLICIKDVKKPKSYQEFCDILNHQATTSFSRRSLKMFITLNKLSKAALYVSWTDQERRVFDGFCKSPANARIMARWRRESAKSDATPKTLAFPTGLPNNISQETMETFIGYHRSERWWRNIYILFAIKMSYEQNTTVLNCLKVMNEKYKSK
ncbi:hypothetical protein JCM33374_g1576 [Metschnikowia sp. JCM 33374]|nr:hypothetical protein JCM33374_g1576 [Metschnikowia sp. JCM 33374]